MPPRPDESSAFEPWSDADFLPVEAVLRARPQGGPPSRQRLSLIRSRLQARLVSRGISSFTAFHDRHLKARGDGAGMQLLIDLSTVNHTTFFREPAQLQTLARYVIGLVKTRLPIGPPIRVWSAGCSAGQEPYSLAMMLAEELPTISASEVEIRATDIALDVVRSAARGVYEPRELADVSADRLHRFFLRGRGVQQGAFRVVPEIRRLITFQHLDLRKHDWPLPDEFEAVLCRNVAIYFEEDERLELLDRLANKLRPGGWLVVGNCEILPERPGLLQKSAASIFRRVPSP